MLRHNAMVLSMRTYTPISYWMSLPLMEMPQWVRTYNEIAREEANHGKS